MKPAPKGAVERAFRAAALTRCPAMNPALRADLAFVRKLWFPLSTLTVRFNARPPRAAFRAPLAPARIR